MTPERQELAFEVFDAAIGRPEAERERFVALTCGDDHELAAEVRSLLAAHVDASGFLSRRAQSASRPLVDGTAVPPTLQTGARLGAFNIETFVGAGGMGEVYRATDTRLDRHVAIKVLLADGAADPRRRARFMSEARAIARLSHPHICALHDIGQHDGIDFLVMEYLEGESLSDRLRKGRLPLAEALRTALGIGRGLAAAHARGIVHRDLKPGNVMLTKSAAKLLDFGLARLRAPATADGSSRRAMAEDSLTTPGLIVGTVRYMSPEQLEGKEVDGRTDIFAFGAVLYEMVTGRKAFQGETPASVISSIMSADPPPISALEPLVPPALDRFVTKCLEKDRDERWSSMHDALTLLEWIASAPDGQPGAKTGGRRARGWAFTTVLAVGAVVAAAIAGWMLRPRPSHTSAGRFDVTLPRHVSFDDLIDAPILSPDGRYVAFAVSDGDVRRLMVRRFEDGQVVAVAGTEGVDANPFWSPDGASIAFFAGRQLKRAAVTGGPVVSVCACGPAYGWDGSWSEEGVLLFASRSGIQRVREDGTGLQPVTRLGDGEIAHLAPVFLPDGRHFLYRVGGARPGIYVASLEGGAATRIVEGTGASRAQYVAEGYVLFIQSATLFAQRFDPRSRQLSGAPLKVVEDVVRYSASNTGVVVYRPTAIRLSRLAWFDRAGRRLSVVGAAGHHLLVSLSPGGKKAALQLLDETENSDLWLLDLTTEIISPLTSDPAYDGDPVWSPDEQRIVFTSGRLGRHTLFQKDLITGKEEPLLGDPPAPGAAVDDWSLDGRYVIFRSSWGEGLYSLPMEGERRPQLIAVTRGADQAHLSPDNKWLAFQTNETGRWEVYVASFPGFTGKRLVSANGGMEPIWRADGRELFYLDLSGRLMAVPVSTQPAVALGPPVELFRTGIRPSGHNHYAAAKDGQKFLLLEPDRSGGESLTFIVDWPARLQPK
jgi:Tol biopolymer transport system component